MVATVPPKMVSGMIRPLHFSSKELKHATLNAQANTMLRSNNFFVPRGIETVEADEEAAA
ncbi:hypothetical protein VU14_15975 [Aeromonas hydrophila]|nr:hypothetical protein VU14_15975 [Aeromonas hydrophila]